MAKLAWARGKWRVLDMDTYYAIELAERTDRLTGDLVWAHAFSLAKRSSDYDEEAPVYVFLRELLPSACKE